MKRRRNINRWIDAPTLVLAVASAALWALWPRLQDAAGSPPRPSPTTFSALARNDGASLYQSPDVFALPSPMGFAGPGLPPDMPEIPVRLAPRESHVLPYAARQSVPAPLSSVRETILAQIDVGRPADPLNRFEPRSGGVLAADLPRQPKLHVRRSGDFRTETFTLPAPPPALTNQAASAWLVSLVVDVRPSGMVEHVIVETRCDVPQINSDVARWVSMGKCAPSGDHRRGRVQVNFGTR